MKTVEFFHDQHVSFCTVKDFAPPNFLAVLNKDDHETQVRAHFAGGDDKLYLMEIKEIPSAKGTLHAHEEDEIFYVAEGEMHFGHRVCRAGDSISIQANTLYAFKAGPQGCRCLKFTAGVDPSFITKD
jgi:quercetin dioxygenase-like cupin family protein